MRKPNDVAQRPPRLEVHLDDGNTQAEISPTGYAPEVANRVAIEGTEAGPERRSWDLPLLSESSHHPTGFAGVLGSLLAEGGEPVSSGHNLAVASLSMKLLCPEAVDDPGQSR